MFDYSPRRSCLFRSIPDMSILKMQRSNGRSAVGNFKADAGHDLLRSGITSKSRDRGLSFLIRRCDVYFANRCTFGCYAAKY